MKESLENIKNITGELYPPAGAKRIAEEIYDGDKKLEELFPDIKPNKLLLDAIKADIARELENNRWEKVWQWRIVALAACLAIVCTLSVKFFIKDTPTSPQPSGQNIVADASNELKAMSWDQSDEIAMLSTKLDNIESAFNSSDEIFESDVCLVDIETQMSELQELFWKG